MNREIPGSAYEAGDAEGRTWDEMGKGRDLVDDDWPAEEVDDDPDPWAEIPAPAPLPRDTFAELLAERLTPDERRHWRFIETARTQASIAAELGISHQAVAKREKSLRTRVEELYVAHHGRPYPWAGGPGGRVRIRGPRPRLQIAPELASK